MKTLDESALRARVDTALDKMCFVLLDPVSPDEVDLESLERHVSIEFHGDEGRGRAWLSAADEFVLEVASGLLGLDRTEIDTEAEGVGALLELANVLCGEVVQLLGGESHEFHSGLPQAEPSHPEDGPGAVTLYFDSMGAPLRVSVELKA